MYTETKTSISDSKFLTYKDARLLATWRLPTSWRIAVSSSSVSGLLGPHGEDTRIPETSVTADATSSESRRLSEPPVLLTTWLPPSDMPPLVPTTAVRHPHGRSVQGPARTGTLEPHTRGCPCPPPDDSDTTRLRWRCEPRQSSTRSPPAWCGPSPACGSSLHSRTRGGLPPGARKVNKMLEAVHRVQREFGVVTSEYRAETETLLCLCPSQEGLQA